jgi:cell division protein FtsB
MLLVLAKGSPVSQHMLLKALKNEQHAAEMTTLKDKYTELADMNHNLNDELNTAEHQNERFDEQLITAHYQIRVNYR